MQRNNIIQVTLLVVEGPLDARFYRIVANGLFRTKDCITIFISDLSRYSGPYKKDLKSAIKDTAERILPEGIRNQIYKNIVLGRCGVNEIAVITAAFGGKDVIVERLLRRLLIKPQGMPEPRRELTLATILDLDKTDTRTPNIIQSLLLEALRVSQSNLKFKYPIDNKCRKIYEVILRTQKIRLLIALQGLEDEQGGQQVLPCLPGGSLEDYIIHLVPIDVKELTKMYMLLHEEGLIDCCNPKHIYALLRLRKCLKTDVDVLRLLEDDNAAKAVARNLAAIDPCIAAFLEYSLGLHG